MKITITKNKIRYFICLIFFLPYLEPLLFKESSYSNIDSLYTILKVVFLAIIVLMTILNDKINTYVISIILFEVLCGFSTIYYNGDFVKYCGPAVGVIGMTLITNYFFPKLKEDFFKLLYHILFIYLVINSVTVYIFPTGILRNAAWSKVYFLGIENRFIFFLLPLVFFATVYSTIKYGRYNIFCYTTIILSIINLLQVWSVGAMIGMIVFAIAVIFFINNDYICKIDFKVFFAFIIILNIGLVFFQIQNYFANFIINVLHKDLTLSGRTFLWNNAINLLKKYPVIGYGIHNNRFCAVLYNGVTHPHNLFLNILTTEGIVGFLVYIIILLQFGTALKKIKNIKIRFIFNLTFFVVLLLSLADTFDVGIVYVIYLVGMMYSGVIENE